MNYSEKVDPLLVYTESRRNITETPQSACLIELSKDC